MPKQSISWRRPPSLRKPLYLPAWSMCPAKNSLIPLALTISGGVTASNFSASSMSRRA